MRELAQHILDLLENAVTAGAAVAAVGLAQDPERDLLEITVEDDGPGLAVPGELASHPFYTTKRGRRTGLGLSLLRHRCEQAGGRLALERSELGGLAVRATLGLSHVDRSPLGDLAGSLSAIMVTHPELDLRVRLRVGALERTVSSAELVRGTPGGAIVAAGRLQQEVREGLAILQARE